MVFCTRVLYTDEITLSRLNCPTLCHAICYNKYCILNTGTILSVDLNTVLYIVYLP